MLRTGEPSTHWEWRDLELGPEVGQCCAHGHEVDDGIDGTDFVEMNGFDRRAVHARLGFCEPVESTKGHVANVLGKATRVQQCPNLCERASWLLGVEVHAEGRGHDAALRAAAEMNVVTTEVDGVKRVHDDRRRNAEVHERSNEHVAR